MPIAEKKRNSVAKQRTPKRKDPRATLNMRIRPELRTLLDHAASITGKTRTDFVLDAAAQAAQTAVLDQTWIRLEPKAYQAFLEMLDRPPQPNPRLIKTMRSKSIWK